MILWLVSKLCTHYTSSIWTIVLNNGFVFVDVYMYIYGGQIRIWIIYIYVVKFEFEFFFAGKSTVGAVLDWTALTNAHSRGG
jgi:hypothetical protein